MGQSQCMNLFVESNSTTLIPYLTLSDPSRLWTPDTFFRNGIETMEFDTFETGNYIRIYPDGDILFSIRLGLKVTCAMHLEMFPWDVQTCSLQIASCKFITILHRAVTANSSFTK